MRALALLARAGIALAFALLLAPAPRAQPQLNLPRDFFDDRRRTEGNALSFCYAEATMTAAFDRDVALALAQTLLLEPRLEPVGTLLPVEPLDYRLPLSEEQIFVLMADRCDAFMGFTLAESGYPTWMTLTRAYLTSRTVMAVRSDAVRRLSDLPLDQRIGARMLSGPDNQLLLYLQALPEAQRWRRMPYRNNRILIDRLQDGSIAAALVWEPALLVATGGDPESQGIHVVTDLPFALPPTELGILVRAENDYLAISLDQAIATLEADGTLARLRSEHGLGGAD